MARLQCRSGKHLSTMRATIFCILLVIISTQAQPIPAPEVPDQCNSIERCCMPRPYTGTPGIRTFEIDEPGSLPYRVRRPVHLLTKTENARIEKAYKLLRELPDTDPRSLLNQKNLHCLYCDNALYYPGQEYPLEIHGGWFFLPWHRMFLYWHERILAKLLDDDTFVLPYWAWDNAQDTEILANTFPVAYANPNSSLWDENRNNCTAPPLLIDLDNRGGGCNNKTVDYIRTQNNRLLYSQLVIGAPTPSLLFGLPYRFGEWGGPGPGTFEDQPHGPVHAWVGNPEAKPPLLVLDDMGNFGRAAFDPVFYVHHGNIDRVWWLWHTKFPGGDRTIPMDSDFNQSQFTFYDENANLVKMNVSQVLDMDHLKYTYEDLPIPWVTNGVAAGEENTITLCNPLSKSAVNALISNTTKHKTAQVLGETPITFKVKRPHRSNNGTEILELSGIRIPNITDQAHWKAYLFFPEAQVPNSGYCPEYLGTFNFLPHQGQAKYNPKRVWRAAVGPKLLQIGKDYVEEVVVTMVQTSKPPGQNITFSRARILYDY